jgi:hypothetical protein
MQGTMRKIQSSKREVVEMKTKSIQAITIIMVSLFVLVGAAFAAQDRFTLKAPKRSRVFRAQRIRNMAGCRSESER